VQRTRLRGRVARRAGTLRRARPHVWDRWRTTEEGRRRGRGYGAVWRRVRDAYLAAHPTCERCGARADEVHHRDHRTPLDPGANDWSNLEALCRRCHRRASAEQTTSPRQTTTVGVDPAMNLREGTIHGG
jgi:5-methylcytosine-specific restriction enzyme A